MALVRDRTLFTTKWQTGLRPVPESAMRGKIAVYTRTVTYSNNVPVVVKAYVYGDAAGAKARIQPLGQVTKDKDVGDTLYTQRILFSVPIANLGLRPETMFVDVIDGGLNPELVGPVFQLKEVLDSSNPIERTFIAEVDTSG